MVHHIPYPELFFDIFRENKKILVKWTLPRWRVQVGSSWCNMSKVRSALGTSSQNFQDLLGSARSNITHVVVARFFLLPRGSRGLPMSFGCFAKTERREDKDKAADILAREAVGHWAARQAQDVAWPSASLCGVGAALDYTVT